MPKCRACPAEIIFIVTAKRAKSMPCNPTPLCGWVTTEPVESNQLMALIDSAGVIQRGFKASVDTPGSWYIEGHESHFGTCPAAKRFRK